MLMLRQPHMLMGVRGLEGAGYDDGAYVATALRLGHSVFPYRDYIFLHPPGITVILFPVNFVAFVASEQWALVVARILTGGVAVANVGLAAFLLRRRGPWAMAVAGTALALWPLTSFVSTTVMIEPYVGFFLLTGMISIFDSEEVAEGRRLFIGGLLLGMAVALKVVAAIPIAVILGVCIWRKGRRSLAVFQGVVLTFAVVALPFVVLAPTEFIRQVFLVQMQRTSAMTEGVPLGARLETIFGLSSSPAHGREGLLAFGLLASMLLLVAVTAFLMRERRDSLCGAVFLCWIACLGFLLRTPDVFNQYPYPATIFGSLILGVCVGEIATRLFQSDYLACRRTQRWAVVVLAVAAIGGAALLVGIPRSLSKFEPLKSEAIDPAQWIRGAVPKGSCVLFDVPTLVVVSDRLSSAGSCPNLIDPFGLWLATEEHAPPGRSTTRPDAFVAEWQRYFEKADYIVLSVDNSNYIPWTTRLRSQFDRDFKKVETRSGIVLYRRSEARVS